MVRLSEPSGGIHLNTVWVEGTMVSNPLSVAGDQDYRFRFRVQAHCPPDPPESFLVDASEAALRCCRGRLARGRTVRVLGRLRQHRWKDPAGEVRSDVKILGDLVEPVGLPG